MLSRLSRPLIRRFRTAPAGALLLVLALAAQARAADAPAMGLWSLFRQSFDIFTVLLVTGSVVAVAVIISCAIDIRTSRILPRRSLDTIDDLARGRRWDDLKEFVTRDSSFVGRVLDAAFKSGGSHQSIHEAAELAASEESARWFRKIELLNIIGNLGPLIGLAGTVWGMILAFTSLGETGGQAGPSDLSLGISKALFHTLLGLCLAIPCLLFFGLYRSKVDRLCTRGMVLCGRLVEQIPEELPADKPARRATEASRD
ncbi:MAG: MotA/TolQ/ExbB proton channel family protein [Phycisphaerales bacterium]|nr:MotA/TolQ/ExbB proton channel family protein [Phycisphaerales bacterium]